MKYAHIDINGKILGWYSDDIHTTKILNVDNEVVLDKSKIPTPNIEVSENDYLKIREEKLNAYDKVTETFIVKDFRTDEEIRKEEINIKIAGARAYLTSTDFYMTVDKYAELDEARKVELTTKRAEARELIRANEI